MEASLVTPVPGICIKTLAEDGGKIFLNICHSDKIPSPPSVSDEDLTIALASMDNTKYRVPMSVGPAHAETDNKGQACVAYDVIVSDTVFEEIGARQGMREFVVELALSAVESKNNIQLNREYTVLAKRTHVGTLLEQTCRVKKKIQEISQVAKKPDYQIFREPEEGVPDFLVVEIDLPDMPDAAGMVLDVDRSHMLFRVEPTKYFLDMPFPHAVNADEVGAQFHRGRRKLTITCPVAR
eukprot:m.239436 g.239436  ORF g.239436 m.239436 type:complete len:239 (+) comp22547_c0_seq1:2-718(+)